MRTRRTAAAAPAPETATRHVGNCQLCEGDFKLTAQLTMVHHGYQRPGDGMIHGDCPAVGAVPYETSCELVKSHLLGVRRYLEARREALQALEGGRVTELWEMVETGSWRDRKRERVVRVKAERPAAHATEENRKEWDAYLAWDRALRSAISEAGWDIQRAEAEVGRLEKRIAAWKPLPVRTVEEAVAEERAAVDARRAVKAEARAAREAKKAATRAKQDALKARRDAEWAAFEKMLVDALAATTGDERDACLVEIRRVRELKKNEWMWHYDCGAPDSPAGRAVLALGVGWVGGHGKVVYTGRRPLNG